LSALQSEIYARQAASLLAGKLTDEFLAERLEQGPDSYTDIVNAVYEWGFRLTNACGIYRSIAPQIQRELERESAASAAKLSPLIEVSLTQMSLWEKNMAVAISECCVAFWFNHRSIDTLIEHVHETTADLKAALNAVVENCDQLSTARIDPYPQGW
jgi:hypothetical protein